MKRQWLQTKKKRDKIAAKAKNNERAAVIADQYQGMLDQDKQIIKHLRRKSHFDIVREYLVHLGLDNREVYMRKICDLQPFQIRETVSRVARVPKKDHYKKYIEKLQHDAPSKRHILEVITKARHAGMLKKNIFETPNSKKNKKIDSTVVPGPPSYKELSERKKKLEEHKKQKKVKNKQDEELKQRIKEEQERLAKSEQEKAKRKPPIVTLQFLMQSSVPGIFSGGDDEDSHNDSAIDFVKGLIADDNSPTKQGNKFFIRRCYICFI